MMRDNLAMAVEGFFTCLAVASFFVALVCFAIWQLPSLTVIRFTIASAAFMAAFVFAGSVFAEMPSGDGKDDD